MTAPPFVASGSDTLDLLLGGGLPRNALIVLTGEPGSGKTVITLQLFFEAARRGERCLYCTTLTEPPLKLLRYLQRFGFFDETFVDNGQIRFVDVGSILRAGGAAATIEQIIREVEEHQPSLVAVDSFKAIHDQAPDPAMARTAVYDLAAALGAWSATTFLLTEFVREDVAVQPEFAVADAILLFTQERQELTAVRRMEVLKARGQAHLSGSHAFDITSGGVRFYRPLPTQVHQTEPTEQARASTGISQLDDLLGGGIPRGSVTLLTGGTGIGKTILSLQILQAGLEAGERAVLISTEETTGDLLRVADGFGWGFHAAQAANRLEVVHLPPLALVPERFVSQVGEAVERIRPERLVIDGLSGLRIGLPDEDQFRTLAYALMARFRREVTLVLTQEVPELLGASTVGSGGISAVTDNILMMRYTEIEASLHRAITVLKARRSAHDRQLWEFRIGQSGIELLNPYTAFHGVLTGMPTAKDSTAHAEDS